MKYPKIETLWKRKTEGKDKGMIIEGNFSRREFSNINKFDIYEKIDGTNIRIVYNTKKKMSLEKTGGDQMVPAIIGKNMVNSYPAGLSFHGRGDNAQIPATLVNYLKEKFTVGSFDENLPNAHIVILYGEGFGQAIQSGGRYRSDVAFILFDVMIDGWWLEQKDVDDIARKIHIDRVPLIGTDMTLEQTAEMVKKQFTSYCAADKTLVAEGIVARPKPLILYKNGLPVMFKLKVKDYLRLKKVKRDGI